MLKKICLVSTLAILAACGGSKETAPTSENTNTQVVDSVSQPENELADFKFHMAIANIPSPFEIIDMLPKSGIPFNGELTNPTDNKSKYQTSTKQALNYGAYVVDLIYLSTNEQYSNVKQYYVTSREFAQKLDAGDSFERIAGSRVEQNIDNKDSINHVMDAVYAETDNYLRSNARLLAATEILCGSWIESQYITLNLLKGADRNATNEAIFQKVYEQNIHAESLVKLLAEFEKEKDFKGLITDIKDLAAMYKEIKSSEVPKDLIAKISDKLASVRGKMIS
ncbi:MAG: hypothetical protein KA450_05095 [Bacteroidia bacterium]|nr:hypothetical protein [Bacteroidota bacterium]MBP6412802.1 hypothetical protein [Bacteroidia bacterium]